MSNFCSPLIFLVFFHLGCIAQNKKVPQVISAAIESNTYPFSKGSVLFNDGSTEEGQLQYNALDGFLVVQVEGESRTYTPAKIGGFSFWDEAINNERVYVTMPWENPANNLMQPAFFEILREFKTFSLLSTRHIVDAEAVAVALSLQAPAYVRNSGHNPLGTKTKIKYQETICFIDAAGRLEPYMIMMETEKDGLITDNFRSKRKNVDADLVQKYTGIHFEKLRKYADENGLNFKRKQDLLTILDYYGTLDWK